MFKEGDKIYYSYEKRIGIITGDKRPFRDNFQWEVKFGERDYVFLRQEHLEKIEQDEKPWDSLLAGRLGNASDLQKYLSSIRLSGNLTNIFYSMRTGTTNFFPHQFKPVLKFIESINGCLLIADEVGLGKTVEALYIWKELIARKEAKRLLIIAPAALCIKWKEDSENFFGIPSKIVSVSELYNECNEAILASHRNENKVWIISLQGIRYKSASDSDNDDKSTKAKLFRLLTDEKYNNFFDLVIIDEAHYLRNSETASFKSAEFIRNISNNMVLLSATPIQTSSDNLYNLLRLLSPEEYFNRTTFGEMLQKNSVLVEFTNDIRNINNVSDNDLELGINKIKAIDKDKYSHIIEFYEKYKDVIRTSIDLQVKLINILNNYYFYNQCFSRTRKRDTTIKSAEREVKWIHYKLNDNEKIIYDKVKKYLIDIARGRRPVETFTLITRLRQLTSSIPAALIYWKEKDSIPESAWGNITPDSDESDLDENGINNIGEDISNISDNIDINNIIKNDKKYNELKIIIENIEPSEKIIIFSFYRYTVKYLHERLMKDGINSVKLWGGTGKESKEEKKQILRDFENDKDIRILISTEVGSEGIDLQFAGYEINYDLPWNPMRIEQRIGRIDRIGQERPKIFIFNLSCEDSIEDDVMERLYDRIDIFTTSIGEIEQIIGERINQLSMELFNPNLSEKQQIDLINRTLKAIENEKQQNEKLEESAGVLNNEFQEAIMENIYLSDKNLRYISKDELFLFIINSLYNNFPQSEIRNKIKNSFYLTLDEKSFFEYEKFLKENKYYYFRQNNLKPGKQILCNFDPALEKKYKDSTSHEFIDSNHSIIKWLADFENKNKKYTKCSGLYFPDCKSIPKGVYIFSIQNWIIEGFRKANELHFILYNLDSNEYIIKNKAEEIFMKNVFKCMDLPESSLLFFNYKDLIPNAKEKINDKISELYQEFVSNFEEQHNVTISQQKDYITLLFNRQKKELELRIAQYEIEGRAENVIKGRKTRLENLIKKYEQDIYLLNEKRINDNMKEVTLGIIFIGEYNG